MKNVVAAATLSLSLAACASTKQVVEAPRPAAETLYSMDRANAMRAMRENFSRVNFTYDSSQITPATRAALSANAELMRHYPDVVLEIEGHCDEQGSIEYNLSLGQRRADAIKKYLVLSGIANARVVTISYGEEVPLAEGSSEEAFAQNRRAEFRIAISKNHEVRGSVPELASVALQFGNDELASAGDE